MRILIVSQYFWPESFRINEVAQSLRDAGCEVTVLTGQPNYPDGVVRAGYSMLSVRTDQYSGLAVHRVPLIPRGRGSGIRLALNYISFVVFASVFGPWHLRGKPIDVVLVHVSAAPIAKHDLLKVVAEEYGRTNEIVPDASVVINRSLDSSRFRSATGYAPAAWPTLVRAMREFG